LRNPLGGTVHLSAGPPFPTDGIISFAIVYFQIAIADVVVVFTPPKFYPTCGH